MPEPTEGKPAVASPSAVPAGVGTASAAKKAAPKGGAEGDGFNDTRKMRRRLIWACIWGYLGVNFLMFLRFFFPRDRKSTRLNSSHSQISYAVFCLQKKNT